MIHSTGVLEKLPRAELETIYAFCAGAGAAPLPENTDHAVLVLLRLIAEQRQPVPEQPKASVGDRLVLPYRAFGRPIPYRRLAGQVYLLTQRKRIRVGEIAKELGQTVGRITAALKFLNRNCGLAVQEELEDYTVTIKDGPIR